MSASRGSNDRGASAEKLAEWIRNAYPKLRAAGDADKKLPVDMLENPEATRKAARRID